MTKNAIAKGLGAPFYLIPATSSHINIGRISADYK